MNSLLNYLYENWHNLYPDVTLSEIVGENLLFDRYKAQAVIGIGGTSIVISANDTLLDRIVAIKIWNPETGTFNQFVRGASITRIQKAVDYFRNEAKLLASLKHDNLCQIYDFGITDTIPWLVMELFEGIPLRALIKIWISNSRLHTASKIFNIIKQVVVAVDYLHKKGLYQLDIKPENILVGGDLVKLIDIASSLEKRSPDYKTRAVRYGTPGYVAPEVISTYAETYFTGSQRRYFITPTSDVFSLGVTFLEMYCLQNPLSSGDLQRAAYLALKIIQTETFADFSTAAYFPDEDDDEVIKLSEKYINELSRVNVRTLLKTVPFSIPNDLIELITKMISINPTDRPRHAGEVLKELINIESMIRQNETLKWEMNPMKKKTVILFLAADPTTESRLRLGEELREIQEKLQMGKLRDSFQLDQRMSVRPADISQALLDVQPDIVHFSGHGLATGELYFENKLGESHPVQPDALAALFEQFTSQVKCVLLNACYSQSQANAIAKHIDYVIGMNEDIGDEAAIAFTIGFYQALGAGRTVEEAYKLGCVQIRLQDIPEHLTPVLRSFGLEILKVLSRSKRSSRTIKGIRDETGLDLVNLTDQLNNLKNKGYVTIKQTNGERWTITALGLKLLQDTVHITNDLG